MVFGDAEAFAAARCVGRWSLFDARRPEEPAERARTRHATARSLCQHCPCRTRCATLAATLPTRGGVWAGTSRDPTHEQ